MRFLFLAAVWVLGAAALAQTPEPGPGLIVTFQAGEKSDTRPARLVALASPSGQAPTPALPVGPFTATWSGTISSPLRAEYTFSADLHGEVKVLINGNEVLAGTGGEEPIKGEPVRLKKGANELRVEFRSPEEGDALLRLYWSGRDFRPEPIPPTALAAATTPELTAATTWREGRALFATRRCTACHEGGNLVPPRGEGMPELAQDAPVFSEFGSRFREPWLAQWINDPHSIRPHALMPRVFAGPPEKMDQHAADLAAYLISLGQPNDTPPVAEQAPAGGALFANLGCVSCHTTPDFQGQDDFNRVPLRHLKAKWQAPALAEYLRDPLKLYKWSRMPNFRLSEEEAGRLTAFLLSGEQKEFAAGPKGDPAKGAALLVSAGCLNCHAGMAPTTAPALEKTLADGWKKGCVADAPGERGNAPDFAFTGPERQALRAFAAAGLETLRQDSTAEFAQRQVTTLRCAACHSGDGAQSVWSQLENETAPLQAGAPVPEGEGHPLAGANAPDFTWLGEKLQPRWSAPFIAGGVQPKPRPWLLARMPGFGGRGELLAQGLSLGHGFSVQEAPEAKAPEAGLVAAGEKLLGENGGFNCTTCHGVGARAPTAVFEAPGINLALSVQRLRKFYYHRWVYDPLRIDPATKMPKFADEEGRTPLSEILGGEAAAQYEAIWQYLRTQTTSP